MVLADRPILGPKHILIVGSGDLGAAVAMALVAQGNTVHVLDRTPEAFDRLPDGAVEEQRIIPVVGDGTSHHDLVRAGIRGVDVFMSVMRNDSDNILAAQVATHEFNVDVVVCRVDDPDLQNMYEEMGLITIGATSLLVEVAVQTATA
ncbi:MAG: NAD-binding protein [Chloroflexi bacterium]|nr:NAD-binding protein [Chloroflexota bacterium]